MIDELFDLLKNGKDIDLLGNTQNITLKRNKSKYLKIERIPNNDTFHFHFNNIIVGGNVRTWKLEVTVYQLHNNVLSELSVNTLVPLGTTDFSRDFQVDGIHFLELRANADMDFELVVENKGYIYIKELRSNLYSGMEFDVDIRTYPRRQEQKCDVPLRFKILEGSLPKGLTMDGRGIIEGVICNLDDMTSDDVESPSFNWFFRNHDKWAQPIGLVFRFKVQVYMLGYGTDDTEQVAERFFCLRVYNNWSYDKGRFLQNVKEIEHEEKICKTPEEFEPPLDKSGFCCIDADTNTVTIDEPYFRKIAFNGYTQPTYEDIELVRPVPELELCHACQDPTAPHDIDILVMDNVYRTPDSLVKYYLDIRNNCRENTADYARLSNSKLFMELIDYIEREDTRHLYSLVEMKLKHNVVTLLKFETDLPLDTNIAEYQADRNRRNQTLEIEANMFTGFNAEFDYSG